MRRVLVLGGFAALAASLTMTGIAAGAANDLTLISRASGPAGVVGNSNSVSSSISADGRYVAFQSSAGNLDPDDDNVFADIFVRDTQANTVTLVSRADGVAGDAGDSNSSLPSISAWPLAKAVNRSPMRRLPRS